MHCMKIIIVFLFFIAFTSCKKNSGGDPTPPALRDGFYKNGVLRTGTTTNSGVAAPPGNYWSEAQHNTNDNSVSNILLGISCYQDNWSSYWAADDFVVPAGQTWHISSVAVYVFGGSGVAGSSPYDHLRFRLWKGKPTDAGAVLVAGDMTTNRLSSSIDSLTYVIQNSSVPAPGVIPPTTNKVWKLTGNFEATLTPGTYWLAWQVHSSTGAIAYSPVVKVAGVRGLPAWNSIVYNALNVWQNAEDWGSPHTLPRLPQDLMFEVVYKY